MICNECLGTDTAREAVALEKKILTEYKTGGIMWDFVYVPVCEEHKSDSTEPDMVIPLPNETEESYQRQLTGAIRGMDVMQADLNNHKTKIDKLEKENKIYLRRLADSGESLEASESIREELSIEIAHVRDNRNKEFAGVLSFIRQYFTAKPFPGMESEGGYPVNSASDEQLIELIGLSYAVVKSRDDLQEFIDTT